jgi:hypothetical protein
MLQDLTISGLVDLLASHNRVLCFDRHVSDEAVTCRIEPVLARLYPIERAIMRTPACTIAGLGVKACHAAYVMSQYWEDSIDQVDWEAQAARLLIEAVCDVARVPLPFHSLSDSE